MVESSSLVEACGRICASHLNHSAMLLSLAASTSVAAAREMYLYSAGLIRAWAPQAPKANPTTSTPQLPRASQGPTIYRLPTTRLRLTAASLHARETVN